MLRPRLRVVVASAVALVAAATLPATAPAAEYDVNVCRHADGSVAPTDGWQLAIADDYATPGDATNTCAAGGQIDLVLKRATVHGRGTGPVASAQLSFTAFPPPGVAWRSMQVWWAYEAKPVTAAEDPGHLIQGIVGATGGCVWGRGAGSCSARGTIDGPPLIEAHRTTVPIAAAFATSPLVVDVGCDSSPLACPANLNNDLAHLRAWRMLVTLQDNSAPAFSEQPNLPATIAGDGVPVRFSATDVGSGVRTGELLVDGRTVNAPIVLDAAGGRCAPQPDGSFDHLAPCPRQVAQATLGLGASSLPDGRHSVTVRVADAAGNVADSAPVAVTVDNPVPLAAIPLQNPLRGRGHLHNGSGSAGAGKLDAGLRRGTRGALAAKARVLPGGRVRIAGRLTGEDGKAVSGASLVLRLARPGRNPQFATFVTGSAGRFSRVLRWGKSKQLAVLWYPWGDSTAPVSSRTLRFLGAARIAMRVTPRSPRNGQALRFNGTVSDAPANGRVTIQVLDGRRWQTFLTPRIDSRGRFSGRRKLVRSAGLSYCLRARVLSQPGFGYSAGFTKPVCRRVRR